MLNQEPQPDARISERTPIPRRDQSDDNPTREVGYDDKYHLALFNLFARVKYWSRRRGPREEGKRPVELRQAAFVLRDAMEKCWRAGYRPEDLARELFKTLND